jgi:hypothetical protein
MQRVQAQHNLAGCSKHSQMPPLALTAAKVHSRPGRSVIIRGRPICQLRLIGSPGEWAKPLEPNGHLEPLKRGEKRPVSADQVVPGKDAALVMNGVMPWRLSVAAREHTKAAAGFERIARARLWKRRSRIRCDVVRRLEASGK